MTIIGIETSTKVCSAALCQDGRVIRQELSRDAGNHAGLLPVYIQQLLAYARQEQLPIDAIALSEGPGSYTGLRIGLSTAKGLCYGLNIPLLPVSTPEVLCHAAIASGKVPPGALLCPMIDARRMEVYTALYRYTADGLQALSAIESRVIAELEGEEAAANEERVKAYTVTDSPEYKRMVNCIADKFGLHSLRFTKLETLIRAIGLPRGQVCTHCFDGSSFHTL